jgi:hypothetical protein
LAARRQYGRFARAQQRKLPVIGYLDIGSAEPACENIKAFQLGLPETGFIEGRHVTFDFLGAEGRYDRLPGLPLSWFVAR